MKILFAGEIIAEPGRKVTKQILPEIIKEHKPDVILANAENSTGGRGVSEEDLKDLQSYGIDYFTTGDHVFWQRGTEDIIETLPVVIPANYPEGTPGKGHVVLDIKNGKKVLLINLMGRTAFSQTNAYLDNPFTKADEILEFYKNENIDLKVVDFHADATSEKYALAFYLDGKVDIIVGSSTHVPTCDGFVLPKKTMYISDIGMSGIIDSILGVKKEIILKLFSTARNQKFEWEENGRLVFRSVLFDTEEKTITRIDKQYL